MAPSGLLIVDKPTGITSHGVVAEARRILGTRKIGHAGTLDPMATGVLILGIERGTRLLGHLALKDKAYAATIRLGSATDTDDAAGQIVAAADPTAVSAVEDESIHAAFAAQRGDLLQVPSSISAIKVDGRRAYARARAGEPVELPARPVHVARLDILRIERTAGGIEVDAEIECQAGTYVRAIARDAGRALGIGGHLAALRRTRVGPFTLADAATLEVLRAGAAERVLPLGEAAARCFRTWQVDDALADDVRHGRRIEWSGAEGVAAIVDASGRLLALAEPGGGRARYLVVFAEP